MVKAYIGVTDGDWYRFLAESDATEVNFWQPSGGGRFAAIPAGAPFLFKTHYNDSLSNRIVGGGFLSGWAPLTVSRAWEFFGEDNGCATGAEMRTRIAKYRRSRAGAGNPEVGCIMLRDVRFFAPEAAPAAHLTGMRTSCEARPTTSPRNRAATWSSSSPPCWPATSPRQMRTPLQRPTSVERAVFGAPIAGCCCVLLRLVSEQ